MEDRGAAALTPPAQDDAYAGSLERRVRFAQGRDCILDEYDELFRRLADA
ncbi:hypothetical protein [Deinococcus planocerae]|nr:hypothetical protein [Deinococcus planocerae]